MAAPPYVPRPVTEQSQVYESPPWLDDPWWADRPGDLPMGQPVGPLLGTPGPDQGYILTLAHRFDDDLVLGEREHRADVVAGCSAVGLKRASLYGRAPVIYDLTVAFRIWGYLGDALDDLYGLRRPLFEEAAHPAHYVLRRRIADMVPAASLRQTPEQVEAAHEADWRSLIDVP